MDIRAAYFFGGIGMEENYHEICFLNTKKESRLYLAIVSFDDSIRDCRKYLSNEEENLYQKLRVDSRRNQFIAGRYIAKNCIRILFPSFKLKSINIAYGVWGFPLIHTEGLYQTCISIAHSDHYAASLFFSSNTHPIGIDIEEINEKHDHSLKRFMSAKEKLLIEESAEPDTELLHLFWSSKEAVGKALKIGFRAPDNMYSISKAKIVNGIFYVNFDQLPQLNVIGWIRDDYIICVAFPSEWSFKTLKKPGAYEKENHT